LALGGVNVLILKPEFPRATATAMSHRIRRREFLAQTSKAVIASSVLPVAGCVARRTASVSTDSSDGSRLRPLVDALDDKIPKWMRDANVPGLAISIIEKAKLAWRRGFGVKDAASRAPVTDETVFEAASMSKPVFAYVIMKLCDAGMINLDTPLTRYTSERFLEGDPRLDLITARHVLSHTSGFQNWRSEKEPLKIHFTPGEKFLYSGEGYNYLQTIVTNLLRQPFETTMQARLFGPLAMRSSGYVWSDSVAKRMARPHDASGRPLDNKKSTPADVARYGSAGALLTTPTDYAKFVISIIEPGRADAFHLSRDSLREMLRPQVRIDGGRYPASWALGWQVFHNTNRDFIYHGGDNEGFHCAAVASVAGKSGFVAMTNGENGPSVLTNLLTDHLMQEFLAS
jgi:CubicO group peptidase (beta-lactamase class C family)